MTQPADQLVLAMCGAAENASVDAHEARQIILGMPGKSANYLHVMHGILESMQGEDWGDFDEAIDSMRTAIIDMAKVRAYTPAERSEWAAEIEAERKADERRESKGGV